MIDSTLLLRNAATTATFTGDSKNIGQSLVPEVWLIQVPKADGTTPKMVLSIQESSDNSNWLELTSLEITAGGQYFQTVVSNKKYRRCCGTITGTNPDFGTVVVGRAPAGHYNKF